MNSGTPAAVALPGVLVGRNDEVAEHLHGAPLVVVEDLARVRLLRRGRGGRGVLVPGLRLRGSGGGSDSQDCDQIAAGDVHGFLLLL